MAWVIGIIGSIIAGGIIGFIARAIVPGKQNLSIPMTVGLGVVVDEDFFVEIQGGFLDRS